ncbi:hypothetical protein CRG98_030336 [Punica granatum]|uniref:Uncharacterized protein n=1 Tax=Punica granatum TaxID=22663 RepID=A0A2I0IZV6_PUNGR|nr:hypothetical protein CRG98_030336 [Punica granatum]
MLGRSPMLGRNPKAINAGPKLDARPKPDAWPKPNAVNARPKPDEGPKPKSRAETHARPNPDARPKPNAVSRPSVHDSPCHGGRVKVASDLLAKIGTTQLSCRVSGWGEWPLVTTRLAMER